MVLSAKMVLSTTLAHSGLRIAWIPALERALHVSSIDEKSEKALGGTLAIVQ